MATESAGEPGMRPVILLPPDREVRPMSEKQFAALVSHFTDTQGEGGQRVYSRSDQPWELVREGKEVTVRHRAVSTPVAHYYLV